MTYDDLSTRTKNALWRQYQIENLTDLMSFVTERGTHPLYVMTLGIGKAGAKEIKILLAEATAIDYTMVPVEDQWLRYFTVAIETLAKSGNKNPDVSALVIASRQYLDKIVVSYDPSYITWRTILTNDRHTIQQDVYDIRHYRHCPVDVLFWTAGLPG